MAEFISSFTTGFQNVVGKNLPEILPGCKILNIFDGIVHYQFNGNSRELEKIIYFNNTFFTIKVWQKNQKKEADVFSAMVNDFCREKKYFLISKGSFRVRFVHENQFEKVNKSLVLKVEENVLKNSKMKVDRVSPSTEIWFSVRRDGFAFCGQLISKREFTEKNLNKGELRPELAYLICSFASVQKNDEILEPFCGYGSIPVQLSKKFRFKKLYASDIDEEKIAVVKEKKQLKEREFIEVSCENAFELKNIQNNSIDLVITDPPWGFYEDIGDVSVFYEKMFLSFNRVLKDGGRVVVLSARKEEVECAAVKAGYQVTEKIDTLVNGKKAGIYKFEKK